LEKIKKQIPQLELPHDPAILYIQGK
jgi:hypothetical protein